MDDRVLSEKESLELISSMINKAKNRFSENGFLYMLWGWGILVCCLAQFVITYYFENKNGQYVWFITWLLMIVNIFYVRKANKERQLRTYTEELYGIVWAVFIICVFLLMFILIQTGNSKSIHAAILVMYGMPIFLSGIILKFRPLLLGGICCWIFSILSPFVSIEFQLLLIAAAIISGWLIPGYLLQSKYKKENTHE